MIHHFVNHFPSIADLLPALKGQGFHPMWLTLVEASPFRAGIMLIILKNDVLEPGMMGSWGSSAPSPPPNDRCKPEQMGEPMNRPQRGGEEVGLAMS